MANTIKNFLIGVGLDTKDFEKGEKSVSNGLSSFRSKAGFAGAAMVGAFGAAAGAAIAAGSRIDQFALSTEKLNTSKGFVYNLGNAFYIAGGQVAEAEAAIDSLESKLAEYNLAGGFPLEQSVLAGADAQALLQAEDGGEAFRMLGDMVKDMNKEQRRFIQDEFGFSDVAMRMLGRGTEGIDRSIAEAADRAELTQEATDASRDFNRELALTKTSIEGISNTLSEEFLPALTGILGPVNDFLVDNKDGIAGYISGIWGMQSPARMIANHINGEEDPYKSWTDVGSRIGDTWDSTVGDFSPIDSSMEWLGNRRQDAIERRTEYRESIQNTEYPEIMSGSVDSQEAIQATPEYSIINNNSSERMTMPPQQINNNLDVKLQMDGREIDTRVVDVIERRERATVEDMQSTTVR